MKADNKIKKKLSVCVEISREWEGEKVAKDLSRKIKNKVSDPKFILLFTTIDYKNEFKPILSGIKSTFPKSVLIGGTVAGFITPEGCYTRGVTAFALNYSNMDIAVGVGHNTKRNPKNAANECIKTIEQGLKESKYKNKILFNFIAGTEIPQMPGMGRGVIRSGTLSKLVTGGMKITQFLFQKSVGREEDILSEILRKLPDYNILGGSTIDNVKMKENFQFFGTQVFTNSIVCLALSTDLNTDSDFGHGAIPQKEFEITKISENKQIVYKINNKSAPEEFSKILNKPEDLVFNKKYYMKWFPYFPCGIIENNRLMIRPFVLVLKDSMLSMSKFTKKKAFTLMISGRNMINAIEKMFNQKHKSEFGLSVSCAIRLMTLGSGINYEREIFLNYFGDKPFLVIYAAGENVRKANENLSYLNEATAVMMFWR